MTAFRTLDQADRAGKRVLLRLDLNVPMAGGVVADATRIERALPTIRDIVAKGGKAIVMSHFGRPRGPDDKNSLRPVAAALGALLGRPVAFAGDCVGQAAKAAIEAMKPGDVLVLENTRFHAGEEANDPAFVAALAENGDLFVNDAFSAAHRAHASTEGVARLLPAFAGRAMEAELAALAKALERPERPLMAIVGGAKISTKLELLGRLTKLVDCLAIGGGMANTFLAAKGYSVGRSLCEHEMTGTARAIMEGAAAEGCDILAPVDVVVAREFKALAPARLAGVDAVGADEMILDIGPATIAEVTRRLGGARTLLWNGPFGAFELTPFDAGTVAVAKEAARLTKAGALLSVAGGGDTVAALNHAGVADDFTYVSTAGGAFLEWLEGKTLPGVEALRAR